MYGIVNVLSFVGRPKRNSEREGPASSSPWGFIYLDVLANNLLTRNGIKLYFVYSYRYARRRAFIRMTVGGRYDPRVITHGGFLFD